MKQIDYESRVDPPKPGRDLNYGFGCFPAMLAVLLAGSSLVAGAWMLDGLNGREVQIILPFSMLGLTVLGGVLTRVVLKRSHGFWLGIPLLILVFASLVLFCAAIYRMVS